MKIKNNFFIIVTLLALTFTGSGFAQKIVKGTVLKKSNDLLNITSPANNTQVASPLIIKGIANKNKQVEVNIEATFTGGSQDLGTFKANVDSRGQWSTTPINLWVPEDAKNVNFLLTATQTVNNKKSTSKTVTILPPQTIKTIARAEIKGDIIMQVNPKVAQKRMTQNVTLKPGVNPALVKAAALPEITSPSHQAVITTPLIVEGTAKRGSTISVTVKSNIAKPEMNSKSVRAEVDEKGNWKTPPINLWLFEDATDARFTISVSEKMPGIDQPLIARPITVIPSIDQNFPRHPRKPKLGSISKAGENDGSRIIMGSAGPNRTIQIYILSHYTDSKGKRVDLPKVNSTTTSDNKGKWATSPIVLPTPKTESQLTHNISINQIGFGQVSGNTSVKITSDPNRVVKPVITSPNSRDSAKKNQVFSGTGIPDRFVEVTVFRWDGNKDRMPPLVRGQILGAYRVKVDANGTWQTPKMDMGKVKDRDIVYKFTVVQIFPQYDHKKNDGTYPEVLSEPTEMTLRQAGNF